jgi:hypothetical protein
MDTLAICGYSLIPGQFSSRILNTDSQDAKLFINCKPTYYLTKDGRLLQIPRGAQSDGISAPQICAAVGREHGGDDWIAGWIHDGVYRGWLMIWNGTGWEKARLSKSDGDNLLYECAIVCGDTEAMAASLRWAVIVFGERCYDPTY